MKSNTMGTRLKRIFLEQKVFTALIVIFVIMAICKPAFYSSYNMITVLESAAVFAIIGFGETLVIICGGCDLSVGGTMCLSGILTILLMAYMPLPLAILIALAAGGFIGFINGFLSVHQKTEPFVITLGMGLALTGVCLQVSNGRPVYPAAGSHLTMLGTPLFLVGSMFVIMFLMYALIRYTSFGRNCYAIGGDYDIAVHSGISAMKIKWLTYVICGVLAAIAGVLLSARLNSCSATYGETTALYVCCFVVLGGTSFAGGIGGIIRTALGILLFSVIDNAMPMFALFSANVYLQQMIKGVLVIVVIGLAYYADKKKREKV